MSFNNTATTTMGSQYLNVSAANNYLRPPSRSTGVRKRLSRSISPAVSTTSVVNAAAASASKTSALRAALSTKSLNLLGGSNSQLNEDSFTSQDSEEFNKSIDSLCFGRAKKKLHRRAYINEEEYRPRVYTNPEFNNQQQRKPLSIPILTIPTPATPEPLTPVTTPKLLGIANKDLANGIVTKRQRRISCASAISLLADRTLMVTGATMGFKANSEERLTQHYTKSLNKDVKHKYSRSTSSVNYDTTNNHMAPLQNPAEATQSANCLNTFDKSKVIASEAKQQSTTTQSDNYSSQNEIHRNFATSGNRKIDAKSLKSNPGPLHPLQIGASTSGIRNISPLRGAAGSSSNSSNSNNTAKHEHSATAAATAAAAAAAASSSSATPPEKEKKRKEVSSSRVKKFHRHFSQVPKDEKLINYFSCALVSDILLQGHLYITDQHFAFYSNVFGYVTKVVIPTSSVTKISKEKTAKIIPNAVGVATADERHVFGSFISREAAFRLMCSVCPPLEPAAEILPKMPADVEISEEYSIEDDSSCSISGNESPPQGATNAAGVGDSGGGGGAVSASDVVSQPLLRRNVLSGSLNTADGKTSAHNDKLRHSEILSNGKSSANAHSKVNIRASAPPATQNTNNNNNNNNSDTTVSPTSYASSSSSSANVQTDNAKVLPATSGSVAAVGSKLTMIIAGTASSTSASASSSTSSSPTTTVMATPKTAMEKTIHAFKTLTKSTMLRVKFPTELHIVYLGAILTVVLALLSLFLMYRIFDIEAKTSLYRSTNEFDWGSVNDEDIFAQTLRWQKELQTRSTEEAQNILNTNLEQIAKVRRSLETLSMLFHDRSSIYAAPAPAHRDKSD